jgi:hypothetical protein
MRILPKNCWFAAVLAGALVTILCGQPQKKNAPSGYYPFNYTGMTFTGRVESIDTDRQELTLLYTKRTKEERFVGRLEAPCSYKNRNGATISFGVSRIPKGVFLTAFYISKTVEVAGEQKAENRIFAVSYDELEGKEIPDDHRITVYCSPPQPLKFMAF